ncbi:uncharacterized protein LOC130780513 [Actinidia eriantha]|uniref:uncharacterized protein LOC130780513 n=1 Tax=Actinidia eriantha TaxID=165200 RepID=UPI002585F7CC|nr:uncharacterized protein LOC130780513 [Actinidia eriantha]
MTGIEVSYHPKLDMREVKNCAAAKKKQSLSTEVQNSLKQEILHLQKQLEEQFVVRSALEKALTNRPLSHDPTNKNSITKPVEDLIKEIAVLELEVVYLEKYLLSLYRKTFDEKSRPIKNENLVKNSDHSLSPSKESGDLLGGKILTDSSIHRSHSSLSQHSARSFRIYAPTGALAEAVESYHSLPLSMLECARAATSNATSLAEHVGASIPDRITETPNWVSEEMIKCISSIYNELAEPPLINHGFPSPISFSSSASDSSPHCQYVSGSPKPRKSSSCRSWIHNPFNIEGSKEFSGSCSSMIEVQWISRDSWRLRHVKHMLQHYRSLVARLEEADPERMKHEEKLAFWINVHNALVMHAFLVYGIPNNNLKRISLLLKAAYNVGGRTVSVDMMQNSILGCRLPRPGQWLQSLFFPKTKFKVRDARKAYAIEHPEPRLYFALCSGRHSDPVVRMYTPKGFFQELEAAKEDYIQTNLRVHKEQKIVLPKIVDSFAKDSGLCPGGLIEMIEHFFPNSLRRSFQQHQHGKISKRIEWIPHNFTFRYLLSKELTK